MEIGDLVKRIPSQYANLLTPEREREIGIVTAFDEAEEWWSVIVSWLDGISWENPDDIEVIG